MGAYLHAFGGEGITAVPPGCMTMYHMATRKMEEVAKPPRLQTPSSPRYAIQCWRGLWWPAVQPVGLG